MAGAASLDGAVAQKNERRYAHSFCSFHRLDEQLVKTSPLERPPFCRQTSLQPARCLFAFRQHVD
jgi:hypothetical protein